MQAAEAKEEEDEVGSGCRRLLKCQIMLCSSRLASTQPLKQPEMRDTLNYLSPFCRLSKFKSTNSGRWLLKWLVEILIHLFSLSITIIHMQLLLTEFQRDSLFIDWRPVTNNLATKCNTSDPRLFINELDFRKTRLILESTLAIKNSINYMYVSNGNCILGYTFILGIMAGYFYVGIILGSRATRMDLISFLCNPALERKLAREEIDLIFNELNQCLKNTVVNSSLRFDSIDSSQEELYTKQCTRRLDRSRDEIKINYKRVYGSLLDEIRKLNLVNPSNLTKSYYSWLTLRYQQFVASSAIVGTISCLCFTLLFFHAELSQRVKTRLSYYNCRPKTSLTKFIYISLLEELPAEEEAAFMRYNGTIGDRMSDYLGLLQIEFKYYFHNNNTALKSGLSLAVGAYCHLVLWFFASLYIFTHVDKMFWVGQIKRQLAGAINLMNELNESNHQLRALGAFEGEQNRKLYAQITVAYVNFELFRKRHRNFQLFASLLMHLTSLITAPTILSILISLKLIPIASKWPIFLALTYLVIYTNIYLVPGAMFMNKMQEFRAHIIRLLASSKRNNFQYCHLMDSWLRQLKSPDETDELFAPSIYGIYLSYNKFIRINVYLFALYCVLYINHLQ